MDHVAIMQKSWGLLEKLKSGQKTIESRWSQDRRAPWGKISVNDRIYFKESGRPVELVATVAKLESIKNLTHQLTQQILTRHYQALGMSFGEIGEYQQKFIDKKYCLLIYLCDIKPVPPFNINKKGFGAMAAWLTIPNIQAIKLP